MIWIQNKRQDTFESVLSSLLQRALDRVQWSVQSSSTFTPPLKITILAQKGVNLENVKNTGAKLNKTTIWHYSMFFILVVNTFATVVSPNKGTWKLAKLGQIRKFFPYLCDSLIWKLLTKFLRKVRSHVLKLAFQTIVVKYELSFVVLEDKFSIFGPKVSSFIRNGPQSHLFSEIWPFFTGFLTK